MTKWSGTPFDRKTRSLPARPIDTCRVCMCVRACVHARARVRVRVHTHTHTHIHTHYIIDVYLIFNLAQNAVKVVDAQPQDILPQCCDVASRQVQRSLLPRPHIRKGA